MPAKGHCFRTEPGIKGRLPAACLGGGKFNPDPRPVQHMNHGLPNLREKRIDQTGDEKLYGFSHKFSGKIVHQKNVIEVTQLSSILV
jgi:hypothetical protein